MSMFCSPRFRLIRKWQISFESSKQVWPFGTWLILLPLFIDAPLIGDLGKF